MSLCEFSYCTRPVFSHGYCASHQRYRTDDKYKKTQEKARQKKSHASFKIATRDLTFGFKSEIDLFRSIWQDRSHVCQFTGEDLEKYKGTELWINCFLHVLPKKNFGYFKLNPENVVLGHPDFHTIVDQGTEEDRLNYPSWDFAAWDKLRQQMKEEYMKFKKENLLP